MTHHDLSNGRTGDSLTSAPDAAGWTFRAPRFGDLVVCPYCDADTFTCDHCGGERRVYASEIMQ